MNYTKIIYVTILWLAPFFVQAQTDSTKKANPTPKDSTKKTPPRQDSIKAGSFNPTPSPEMANQVRIQMLSDSLTTLYQRYLSIKKASQTNQQKLQQVDKNLNKSKEGLAQINQKNQRTSRALSDSLKSIFNQHNTLRQEVNVGVKAIKDLKIQDLLDAKNRYTTNITSIKTTASFIYAFNNGLNGLEASLAYADYANAINELNNPQNNELGFSLEADIVNLVRGQITGKLRKFRSSKSARFFKIISNIIRNPITQSLVSSVPAVNSINSVNNLVNNLVVNHRGVSPQQLLTFQQGLRKYVEHYDNLSALNKVLAVSNENLKVKTEALRKLTNEFVKELVVTLYDDQSLETLKKKSLNNIINEYYTYSRVLGQIEKVEKKYSIGGNLNYSRAIRDKRVGYSLLALNKIEFITGEIEKISSEYLTALEEYHKNIILVLMGAYKLSKNTSKIDKKIKLLNQQFEKVKVNYAKQVDLKTILSRLHEIPRY
ncbi:hypothetical protein BKI52_22290 [marine bacterium AO1-C]|nr:hypothetical protein BKI52_22290 [marine bacterium AO1-C]